MPGLYKTVIRYQTGKEEKLGLHDEEDAPAQNAYPSTEMRGVLSPLVITGHLREEDPPEGS